MRPRYRSRSGGKERLQRIECEINRRVMLTLAKGLSRDCHRLELSNGKVGTGRLSRKGKAKGKIAGVPAGEGTAVTACECGAKAKESYRCPQAEVTALPGSGRTWSSS